MGPSVNERKKTKIIVKSPTQERSRQTVSTILDACARLMVTEGFYSITTDKIAKEAGVSIGSLYQFFGNKESVVQALIKNIMDEDKRLFEERLGEIGHLTLQKQLEKIVDTALVVGSRNAELRAKITTIRYYVGDQNELAESHAFFKKYVYNVLPKIPGRDNDKVSTLMVHTFTGILNTLAMANPKAIHDPEVAKEISLIFTAYLTYNPQQT